MKPSPHPPWFKTLILIFHLKLCCFAAYAQQPPITDNLVVVTTTYNAPASAIIESAINTVQTQPNNAVIVNPNANVTFEAGVKVTLKSGFNAKHGSKFRARTGLSLESLLRPTETEGLPLGLIVDSNNNGIPDLVEISLGLDPTANNTGNPQIQNIKRQYQYDANSQLINAPERTYQLDAEGNIKSN